MKHILKIGMAQIAPVWLDKTKTIEKIKDYVAFWHGVEVK